MGRFASTRVIVTGGCGGIGARIASRFADEGAAVLALDARRAESAVPTIPVDLTEPGSVADAFDVATRMLGGVDVLVNAAGVFQRGPLLDVDPEAWDRVLAVNAKGTLLAMQAAARSMLAQGGGSIVNLASMVVHRSGCDEGVYAASKAAVVALTRAAAAEWGPSGVRVNAIAPGYVLTDMGADTRSESDVAAWTALSPLGRLGTPDDVAGVALFLASDDGAYLTGQTLGVTGGMVMP